MSSISEVSEEKEPKKIQEEVSETQPIQNTNTQQEPPISQNTQEQEPQIKSIQKPTKPHLTLNNQYLTPNLKIQPPSNPKSATLPKSAHNSQPIPKSATIQKKPKKSPRNKLFGLFKSNKLAYKFQKAANDILYRMPAQRPAQRPQSQTLLPPGGPQQNTAPSPQNHQQTVHPTQNHQQTAPSPQPQQQSAPPTQQPPQIQVETAPFETKAEEIKEDPNSDQIEKNDKINELEQIELESDQSDDREPETSSDEELMGDDYYFETCGTLPNEEEVEDLEPKCEEDVLKSIVTTFSGPSCGSITYQQFKKKNNFETIFDRFDELKEEDISTIHFLKVDEEEEEKFSIEQKKILEKIQERYSDFYNKVSDKEMFSLKDIDLNFEKKKKNLKNKFRKNVNKTILASKFKTKPDGDYLNFFHNYEAVSTNKIIILKNEKLTDFKSSFIRKDLKERKISPLQAEDFGNIRTIIEEQLKGKLTSFCVSKGSKQIVILGSEFGEILEVDFKNGKIRSFSLSSKISTCDVSEEEKIFCVGTIKGEIFIKKTFGNWAKKKVTSFCKRGQIVQVRFFNDSDLLVCTNKDAFILSLTDMKLTFEVKTRHIFQNSPQILQILPIPFFQQLGFIITITEVEHVRFISFQKGQARLIGEIPKPEEVQKGLVPTVSYIEPQNKKNIFGVIFWGNFIYLFEYKNESSKVEIVKNIELETVIIWGEVLSNRIVCFLSEDYNIYFQHFEELFFSNRAEDEEREYLGELDLQRGKFLEAKVICVRDDGQLTRTLQDRIRSAGDELEFLESKGVTRIKLLSFKEMCYKYIDHGKWLNSLLLSLDVISKKVKSSTFEIVDMKKELENIIDLYLNNFIKNFNEEEIYQKVLKTAIETLITGGRENLVFELVKKKFDQKIFWGVIDEFISYGKITEVPLSYIVEGAQYIKTNNLESLLLNFTGRQFLKDYESFNQILMMLKSNQLWSSFCKIALNTNSQSYKIFLSTILNDVVNSEGLDKKLKSYLGDDHSEIDLDPDFRIFWFLWKIFKWKNFQILVIDFHDIKKKEEMWKFTLEWMFEDLNGNILGHKFIQLYLEIFYEIFLNKEIMTNNHVFKSLVKIFMNISSKSNDDFYEKWHLNVDFSTLTTEELILNLIFATTSEEFYSDISFLVIKILGLNSFQNLLENKQFIVKVIESTLSCDFNDEKFWLYYRPLDKLEFEDMVLNLFMKVSKNFPEEMLKKLELSTKENG